MRALVFVGAMAAAFQSAAWAQTRALPAQAKAIVDRLHQGAREDCREQRGTLAIANNAVTQAELNGDGQPDYLVDSGAYQCSSAASLYCGTLGCSVETIVSSPSGYREIGFAITHSPTVLPNAGGDILEVDVRASDCGPRANRCIRYWRLIGSKFEMFTTQAAARAARQIAAVPASRPAPAPLPALTPLRDGFRVMQLPSGQRVAALNGTGMMRTLSVGCRGGTATMLLATRTPARPAEVVIRTPTRAFTALPSAAPRPDLWEFRLSDPALFNVLTSPEAGFSVSVGGADAGQYALANGDAVRSVLAPCASAIKAPAAAGARTPTVPAAQTGPAAFAGFSVNVTLSARAATRLAGREGILVWASYYGDALRGHEHRADEQGIALGDVKVPAPGRAGVVTVGGATLRRERLGWVDKRSVQASVSVLSARRSSPDNLLDCQPWINAPIMDLSGRGLDVHCKLIGE